MPTYLLRWGGPPQFNNRLAASLTALTICAAWASAQTARPKESSVETLRKADTLYGAEKFLEAEEPYRRALPFTSGEDRRRCYERLLRIYALVGRQDQAVGVGLEFEEWLRRAHDDARASEVAQGVGGCYLALGHLDRAEEALRRSLTGAGLPDDRKVMALTYLAQIAEKQDRNEEAGTRWRAVEKFARAHLERPREETDQRPYLRGLSESCRFQKRPSEAANLMEKALPLYDRLNDGAGKRDALRALAGYLAAAGRRAEAIRRLQEALDLHEKLASDDRLARADLRADLADVNERQGRKTDAQTLRARAAEDYRNVLKERGGSARRLAAYWGLQALFQRARDYRRALDLAEELSTQWSDEALLAPRLRAEQGGLRLFVGEFERSRDDLRAAVKELEGQTPPNLIELPRALLNLAAAELANGEGQRAAELAGRCRDLYRKHGLRDDAVLAETFNLLGVCAAQGGEYARAVDWFRAGEKCCGHLGPDSAPQRGGLLLNLALLYKAQGDLKAALSACEQAREVYQTFAEPDALALAALDAARASILASQRRLGEAAPLATRVLQLCDKYGDEGKPLRMAARHCQALNFLARGEYDQAEKAWKEVQELHGDRSPLMPRTLNYLALTKERRGKPEEAAALYRKAEALERASTDPRGFPATQFITLWRLAVIDNGLGQKDNARALLTRAVETAERARTRPYGDAQQRAEFFAQFAPGFELLVEWRLRDGDVEGAVVAAARARSRTLLDQLQLAGVDPTADLPLEKKELRDRFEEARRRVVGLRGWGKSIPAGELDKAQEEYATAYRELLSASPAYRAVGDEEFSAADLTRLRKQALGPKKVLLVYFVGRTSSSLLLLPGGKGKAEGFALTVPADVAQRVAALPRRAASQALGGRGLRLPADRAQPELPAAPPRPAPAAPLGQETLRALVEAYLEQIGDPQFKPTRGLRLPHVSGKTLPDQRPELLADVLLPAAARARLRELDPECLVLVPDGALHKLPFEALVLESGPKAKYALDVLPPIAYVPSVAALGLLAERKPAAGRPSLLTVANPTYPQRIAVPLPLLPFTAVESKQIARAFEQTGAVMALREDSATKKALVEAASGRRFLHIAAHGFADEQISNQFGALALKPSAPGWFTPGDNGYLYLHEIYHLPLSDCELAVLSGCSTNAGPQRPLEAGVTLAHGFLVAGARRVVASHWGVNDESTAALMVAFFKEATAAAKKGKPIFYPGALRRAQQKLRGQDRWAAPFYWSAFVLVGPPD
jgi:CHAT domain-containing protein/tetratricopeptide (TPR) repeat protein